MKCERCNSQTEIGSDGKSYDICNSCTRAMIADVLRRQTRG